MEDEKLEFFKLDVIDRKVLLWLIDHAPEKSVLAWIEYITEEYQRGKAIKIDGPKLFSEVNEI